MKIIADSGATKGDWRLVTDKGEDLGKHISAGTNVSAMQQDVVCGIMSEACWKLVHEKGPEVKEIWLYAAGIITEDIRQAIQKTLKHICPNAGISVEDDMTGVARAACGNRSGIAAIIGTGSNACLYDGSRVVRKVYSGGFILGDEGSAATLGKLFISDFIKGIIPQEVAEDFAVRFPSDYATIIENVYRSSGSPSGYLGSLAPFIMEHYGNPYIKELVDGNFRAFIRRSLKQLDTENLPVGVIGGFGFALREIFTGIADEEGVRISKILPAPIDGLISCHCTE